MLEIEEDAASSELTTEEAEESPVEEEEQIPEWLANLQSPETGTPADEIDRGLDWMKDISPEPQAEISNLEEGQLPDWLTAKETEGVSDSIEEDQGEETEMPHLYEAPDEIEDTQPTKIKRDESTKPEIDIQNDKPLESDQEFPMPWMDSFDDKTDESDTAQFTSPEEPGEEMPDWIQDIIAEEDVPEFREKPEQTMAPTSAETPAQIVDSANELEELLGKIAEGMPPEPEPIVGENREEIDFLKGVGELQEEGEDASSDQPDHSFGMKDSDEAFAWLEALAAKQGADEETLMAPPEHRVEEPPEWIKAEVEDSGVVGMEPEVEPEGEIQEPEVTEELHELDAESKAELEELEVKPEHDLQEPEAKPVEEFQELEAKAVEEIEETDKIIDKQKIETQPEDIVEEPEIGETDQAIPEWLQNISADEEEPKEEIEFAIGSEEDKSDEGMDWLKRIAGDEEEPVTKTEEPGEIVEPESTQIPGAFKEEEAILHEAMPAESEELPDWLKGIDEEKPDKEPLQEFQPEETSAIPEPQEQQPEWIPEMVMEEEEESIPSEEEIAIESLTGPEFETTELAMVLKRAQEALEAYNIERALENYQQLIQSGQYLEETIHDLRDALYRYPIDVSIWQLLGDAYMKSNHLQDALDAYTKAEELLR